MAHKLDKQAHSVDHRAPRHAIDLQKIARPKAKRGRHELPGGDILTDLSRTIFYLRGETGNHANSLVTCNVASYVLYGVQLRGND